MIRREYEGGLLLISQTVHAWVSGQLARRWGNQQFARPEPWEDLILVAGQHDNGWAEWELAPRIHRDGHPVSFTEMELEEHFAIWQRSAERMQTTSLYGALLISKHAAALYKQRLEQDARGDTPEMRARIQGFIEERREFEAGIRRALEGHPRYGPILADGGHMAAGFRLLQVWDLLSLLLLMGPLPEREITAVPVGRGEETTIELVPYDARTLTLDPYPFAVAPFAVQADGRWLAQRRFRHNALFRQALAESQYIELELIVDRPRP
jgi:hypothetical protein